MKEFEGIIYSTNGEELIKCESFVSGDVVVANGVKTINDRAFKNCKFITSITLPESVERIGKSAFEGTSITSMVLPKNVTHVFGRAFAFCSALKEIQLSPNLEFLGGKAFWWCVSLTEIDLENTCVHKLREETFSHCIGLKTISLSKNIDIADFTFFYCENLSACIEISRHSKCKSTAFAGCKKVSVYKEMRLDYSKRDIIEEKIVKNKTIPNHKFKNAKGLESLAIPYGFTKIGDGAFQQSGLQKVSVPGSIDKIPCDCFLGCEHLQDVKLGEGVKYIKANSFKDCSSLNRIYIPDSVQEIDINAFNGCERLQDVSVGPYTKLNGLSFTGCSEHLEIQQRSI